MPRLVVKAGPAIGRDLVLGTRAYTVGRDPLVDFPLDDRLLSRQHFRVAPEERHWWLEDLGSTNGTFVNGRRERRARLRDGDVIQAGESRITFVQKDLLRSRRRRR